MNAPSRLNRFIDPANRKDRIWRGFVLFALLCPGIAEAQQRNSASVFASVSDPASEGETLADLLADSKPQPVPEAIATARPWLDIRPRRIDSKTADVILRTDLPQDASGLPPLEESTWMVQFHSADLRYSDVARASSHCYNPLYFEDRLLERYGSITGVLRHCPLLHATAQFAWSSAALPASAIKYRTRTCVGTGQPSRCEVVPEIRSAAEKFRTRF